MAQTLNRVRNIYAYSCLGKEGSSMVNGYRRVTGNSNIAFNYPLRALLISNNVEENNFEPDISSSLEEEVIFNNWMYLRKRRD